MNSQYLGNNRMRLAAVNTGPDFHLLDHIAPLASHLEMPLLVTDERNRDLALRYYPQVSLHYMPDLEFQFASLAKEFDALFECKYWLPHLKGLFRDLYGKEMRLIFCPHGQSDKGFQAPLLAPYAQQDAVLLYGELQIQMLRELKIWPAISSYAVTGNYRQQFYQEHRAFYDAVAAMEVDLDRNKKTLLYAPTWRDADEATSFFECGAKVISELPADWNLILKLHPLLEQRDPALFYSIAALAEKKPNAFLVEEFPPVYPILSLADVYLGDSSSVGYDFLSFEKPLYFLPTKHIGRLHACGRRIDPERNLYRQLDEPDLYAAERQRLCRLAFGEPQLADAIRRALHFN